MIDTNFERQTEFLESLLSEADAYGLRWEVETWAQKALDENPEMTISDAYWYGFNEWIK